MADLIPLFQGERITYVDARAGDGRAFDALLSAGADICEAVLLEGDPILYGSLDQQTWADFRGHSLRILNIELGQVPPERNPASHDRMTRTLDEVADEMVEERISVLRILSPEDLEPVLSGAVRLLDHAAIDVIFLDSGADREASAQTCALLRRHGFVRVENYRRVEGPLAYVRSALAAQFMPAMGAVRAAQTETGGTQIDIMRDSIMELTEKLQKTQDRLERAEATVRKREEKTQTLLTDIERQEDQLRQIRHSLGYRLGSAMTRNLRPVYRWALIPGALLKAFRTYRLARTNLESENQRATAARPMEKHAAISPGSNNRIPDNAILWQAQRISESKGIDQAIAFARSHQTETIQNALNLLEANAHLDDDGRWLELVNAYLGQLKISPIALEPGSAPRFHRIVAKTGRRIEEGPLVTIIMPAFNAAATLTHSVESILNQTWQPIELIIVNDCSSDTTLEIASELARQDDRVRVLNNRINVGPYVSKNRALDLARGDWVTGHDADDWAHPERIERQVQAMLNHPGCKVSIGQMVRMEESGRFSHFSKIGKTSIDGAQRLASISCFFDRAYFKETLGHWDSVRFGGDSELIERCRSLLGPDFLTAGVLTMLCLDSEQSLTNHPVHGISKTTGISPSRQYYREQWMRWHRGLMSSEDAYLAFPQTERKFDASPDALVSNADIRALLGT
jgi:hypothetical protein